MRRLKVRFFDVDYVIKTDAEEDYVQKIASYLEEKVKEISKQESTIVVPSFIFTHLAKISR